MTQAERVRLALHTHRDRGITQVDFLRYPTIDGGPPITRLAARIDELRDAGLPVMEAGTRDKCRVYMLAETVLAASDLVPGRDRVVEPASPAASRDQGGEAWAGKSEPDGCLFPPEEAAPSPRNAIYQEDIS